MLPNPVKRICSRSFFIWGIRGGLVVRILGLDGGIASVGWAVVEHDIEKQDGAIIACGTWMFNSPEGQSSTGSPVLKNAERRTHRGQRRVLKRRRQRMAQIRALFHQHGLLQSNKRDALAGGGTDPWELRLQGLDRALGARELALALYHIAKHRGFKSNRKGEQSVNKADDDSKMLAAIDKTREKLAQYRTVGEMFARDPEYANRKRNREGDYTRSIQRQDQETEVRLIFENQRRLGNTLASEALQEAFEDIAFFQRPLQSSLELVGECPFVDGEKRASAFAPSFERFRFLSKLATVRIVRGREQRSLTPSDMAAALAPYGSTKTYSWKGLRKALGLGDDETFSGVGEDNEGNDLARSKGAASGTKTLVDILEAAIGPDKTASLLQRAEPLDEAMAVVAFNEDLAEIQSGLQGLTRPSPDTTGPDVHGPDTTGPGAVALPGAAVEALCKAARDGTFDFVKGVGHISCAAARRLNPHLEAGLRYDQACAREGWDHAAQREWKLEDIGSPVAAKAAREILKQTSVLEREYGPFDRVIVEMAREVGHSLEERGKIEKGLERRTKERRKSEEELKDLLKVSRVSGEDILRYELWKEQNGRCLYTGASISPHAIRAAEIDHILPIGRFADNSFLNKTLCVAGANQNKRDRTPFEWKNTDNPADWDRFTADVESCKAIKKRKKNNLLMMDAAEREEQFRERNLNDTRYALRVVLGLLRKRYPDYADGVDANGRDKMTRRVFARPGAITAALRGVWGLESLKKDENGERLPDDRHHALDAIVTACCSEGLLQYATRHAQKQERRGEKFEFRYLRTPWGERAEFRRDVEHAVMNVFVARAERARLRGKAHDASIRQVRVEDGEEKLYERKSVNDLKLADLDRIPVPKPYGTVVAPEKLRDQTVESLRQWLEAQAELKDRIKAIAGKSDEKTALQEELAALKPLSPKGDVIKKVRLETRSKKAVEVRGGSADRDTMVRVDVFTRPNKKGVIQFYLVPVYRTDVYSADEALKENPPNRAVAPHKAESEWPVMDEGFDFRFTITSFSYIEIVKPDGEIISGYFRGLDRADGKIAVSPHENSGHRIRSGTRTLLSFKKFRVDRLGNRHEIRQETRTWRGKACT